MSSLKGLEGRRGDAEEYQRMEFNIIFVNKQFLSPFGDVV